MQGKPSVITVTVRPLSPEKALKRIFRPCRRPGKELSDKYFLGWYEGERLIAVMDLIYGYPDQETALIGFFMTDVSVQNAGVGTRIIDSLCQALGGLGFLRIRLGWVSGNPQAEHFWHKNHFSETGTVVHSDIYMVTVAERRL